MAAATTLHLKLPAPAVAHAAAPAADAAAVDPDPRETGFGLAGSGYHARDEYIEIDSIAPRLYLMTRMLQTVARAP